MDNSQVIKGVLPVMVLSILESADTYGYAILKSLRDNGLEAVGDASVYGTLQRLAESGFITSYLKESEAGPARRYYSLTESGRKALAAQRTSWLSFNSTVNQIVFPEREL